MKNRRKGRESQQREALVRAMRIAGREHNATNSYAVRMKQNAIRSQIHDRLILLDRESNKNRKKGRVV